VDLSTLLPTQPFDAPPAKRVRVSDEDGQLVLTSSHQKRKLENLHSWLEAWSMYCSVVVDQQPSKASEFLAYQLRIVQAAKQYRWTAVAQYDVCFRQKAARVPTLRWNLVDNDLYARCFTGQAHARPQEGKSAGGSTTCTLFNRGNCSFRPCKFLHKCNSCGGDHSASICRKSSA